MDNNEVKNIEKKPESQEKEMFTFDIAMDNITSEDDEKKKAKIYFDTYRRLLKEDLLTVNRVKILFKEMKLDTIKRNLNHYIRIYNALPQNYEIRKACFDYIQEYIQDIYLKMNIGIENFKLLSEIVDEKMVEDFLISVDELNNQLTEDERFTKRTLAIMNYLWLMCGKNYSKDNNTSSQAYVIEKAIIKHYVNLTYAQEMKNVCNVIPKVLIQSKDDLAEMGRLNYLYFDLPQIVTQKNEEIIDLKNAQSFLRNQVSNKNADIVVLTKEKEELEQKLAQLKEELDVVKLERENAQTHLTYEANKYTEQLETYSENLVKSLRNEIGLELTEINKVVERMPDEFKTRMVRRLGRIEKILDKNTGVK